MIDINSLIQDSEIENSHKKKVQYDKNKNDYFDEKIDEKTKENCNEKKKDNIENAQDKLIDEITKRFLLDKYIDKIKNLENEKKLLNLSIIEELSNTNEDVHNTIKSTLEVNVIDIQYLNDKVTSNIELEKISKLDSSIYDISYKECKNNSKLDIETLDIGNRIENNDHLNILNEISNGRNKNNLSFDEIIKNDEIIPRNIESNNIEETIKNIKIMKNEDIRELVVKLKPRELGDMHIKLVQENGNMKAILSVEDNDVFKMLNKNISELKNHIETFNVKEVEIVIKSDNTYSSDSFDKSFDGYHGNKENYDDKKRNKSNEMIDDITLINENGDENIARIKNGIDLLA